MLRIAEIKIENTLLDYFKDIEDQRIGSKFNVKKIFIKEYL